MSDDTSYDDGPGRPSTARSGSPVRLRTLRRATRWETFVVLAVLLVVAFAFA
ncbi:hypothetical protein [Streptomyces syringium]|uniref:hypothetical protein n=1 Tax=Streptomyces syringium TaxID=76729 RepID=UPI0034341ED8